MALQKAVVLFVRFAFGFGFVLGLFWVLFCTVGKSEIKHRKSVVQSNSPADKSGCHIHQRPTLSFVHHNEREVNLEGMVKHKTNKNRRGNTQTPTQFPR